MALFGHREELAAMRRELAELRQQLQTPELGELLAVARAGVGHLAEIQALHYRILHELTATRLAAAYDRLGDDKVFAFDYEDARIRLWLPTGPSDLVQGAIMRERSFYGARMLEMVRARLPMAGERVLDIGANIGNHTVFFAKVCGAREVEAFEPAPLSFRALRRNAELNGIGAIAHNFALGARSGRGKVVVNPVNLGGSHMELADDGPAAVFALDDLDLAPYRVMKIDVEGWAAQALEGARRSIAANRPGVVIEAFANEIERVEGIRTSLAYSRVDRHGDDYVFLPN